MKFKSLLFIILFTANLFFVSSAQQFSVNKIEPPTWWTGFKWSPLQLMVYGENLNGITAKFEDRRLKVTAVHQAENSDYAFIDVVIPGTLPEGNYKLFFIKEGTQIEFDYPVLKRKNSPDEHKGFTSKDVIYLITPDRFSNGDTSNDYLNNQEEKFKPSDLDGRRGGDITGIINHLDYIKELGMSAIWVTPVLENNMWMSYHGYAATDLYKVDPRFGSNDDYKILVETAHQKNIKVIYDHVSNHIGINHLWAKNPPFSNWFNGTVENHISTNHNKIAIMDKHSDPVTVEINETGWFENYMPDLNQRNELLSNYLIQNTLWWIEYTGLDGVREDTYPYANHQHMAKWAQAILDEYPGFNIVGEVWKGEPVFLSAYQKDSKVPAGFISNTPAVTDFALADAFRRWLSGKKDLYDVYETLVMDYLYNDPMNLVTFLDNHDVERALFVADTNYAKYKTAVTMLLTIRGIPQIYYGTEIGVIGSNSHGTIRSAFPGGFPDDKRKAFTDDGRTVKENDIFYHLKKILEIRNKYECLQTGKLIHFPPRAGVYYYFRQQQNEKIMVAVNENRTETKLDLSYIKTQLTGYSSIKNLVSGKKYFLDGRDSIKISGVQADIFLLE
ncbi:MAG: cyclomaltodextrinase N-terminal domain-containing protein [Ignavibacteriaceae bacterium]|nr:cyclomaltodextrinase N-terminal domain-containing protein [Ignavibacteriaceae bacterium]